MQILTKIIQFQTKGHTDIIDLTSSIQSELSNSELNQGQVHIFAIGSTTGISSIEFEPGLVQTDVKEMYQKIAPYGFPYAHNRTWGDDNGASHLRSTVTGNSYTVPFMNNKLLLGTWQQVVFIDFDTRPRERKVVLQYIGI